LASRRINLEKKQQKYPIPSPDAPLLIRRCGNAYFRQILIVQFDELLNALPSPDASPFPKLDGPPDAPGASGEKIGYIHLKTVKFYSAFVA
jgi:hypothetical protein